MRIYVIEDDEYIRRALDRLLRAVNAEVRLFAEPADAVEQATSESVDVVISDYSLPGIDGLETLGRIRRAHPAARTMLLSGTAQNEAIVHALECGLIDLFVSKPWRHQDLRVALTELMEQTPHARAG